MELSKDVLYILRNKKTANLHIGYTYEELKSFISAFDLKQKFDWYIWCDEWEKWEPVSSFQSLLGNIHREMMDPPEFFTETQVDKKSSFQKQSRNKIDTIEIKDIPDLEIEGEASFDKRAFERVDKNMKVKIFCGEEVFKTNTVDVSAGGVLLQDSVPGNFDSTCTIQVKKIETNQAIEVDCEVLMVKGKRNRVQFVGFDDEKIKKRFYYWLIS